MRALLLLAGIFGCLQAWKLHISPNGDRLANQKSGDNFLVVCSVQEYDGPASGVKINWYKDGSQITFGRIMTIVKPNGSQLMIIKAKKEDSGDYVCKAEIDEVTQEETAHISFIMAPKFVDAKTEQHPEEGKTGQIVCRVEGEPSMEVFWQFNGNTLDESSPRGYEFNDNNQVLVIPNYDSKKDDGHYLCNAAQFSSFETITINVSGYSRPVITVFDGPTNNRGFEGSSVQFKCGAIGKPMPTYKWFRGESEEELVKSDIYSIEDGLLVIHSLTSTDGGEYRCAATNAIGTDEKVATLFVYLRPKVERLSNHTKQSGEDVELVCRYSGEGNLKAKFVYGTQTFKVGSDDEEEETEKLTSEEEGDDEQKDKTEEDKDGDDDGEEHRQTETTETTQAEEDNDENEDDDEKEGSDNNVKRRRDLTHDRVRVTDDGKQLVLSIKDVNLNDAGMYQCIVENEAGPVTRNTILAITHAPIITKWTEETVRSFEGNEVEIFCEGKAVPDPNWDWQLNGDEVEADGVLTKITSTPTRTSINLRSTAGKYGKYTCRAANGVGQPVEKTINVIEVVVPPAPQQPNCNEHVYPNYATCTLSTDQYSDPKFAPTEVEFAYVPDEELARGDFDWDKDAIRHKVPYSERMRVPNLKPKSNYVIRARAINEAGSSEFGGQETIETTDPWAPEAPESITYECDRSCRVQWTEPNNHGAELDGYKVVVQEYKENEETGEPDYSGSKLEISVGVDGEAVDLTQLKPETRYEISVSARNSIGESQPQKITFETPDTVVPLASGFTSSHMLFIVGAALLIVCLVVDLICYSTNRCGLIACICVNCCGKNPDRSKGKDLESGRPAESNRLLSDQR